MPIDAAQKAKNVQIGCLSCLGVLIICGVIGLASDLWNGDSLRSSHANTEQLTAAEQQLKPALAGAVDLPADHSADVSVATTNPDDSYAAEQGQGALSNYRIHRAQAEIAVRDMYFAVGCKVIIRDTDALPFLMQEIFALQDEADQNHLIDRYIQEDLKAAGQSGITRSQSASACDFWHQHPEAVYQVRQLAQAAALAPQQ